jgi:hypothetical protein
MNLLRRLIPSFSGSRHAEAGARCLSRVAKGEEPPRHDAMWDEALSHSMQDETARMFLDRLGPRGK